MLGNIMDSMKISVIIAAYNAASYLKQAVDSALGQTYPPHEIIVADDCSSDETEAIARSFGTLVRVVRLEKNSGPAAARNAAARLASGDWLAFLDADDWFFPEKLAKQKQCADQRPEAVLIYSASKAWINDHYRPLSFTPPNQLWPALRYRCPFQIASVMLRKSAFEKVNGFNTSRAYIGIEDWELWAKIYKQYSSPGFEGIEEPLAAYRFTPGSLSTRSLDMFNSFQVMLEDHLLGGTNGLQRWIWRRRILAFRYYDTSILLREQSNSLYLSFMLRSLRNWPLPGSTAPIRRYKVFLSMLQSRFVNSLGFKEPGRLRPL